MWQVRATFNLFGYATRELDLTPALGAGTIALVVFLLVQTGI